MNRTLHYSKLIALAAIIALFAIGCSDSGPTAVQSTSTNDLWNPGPGDQIVNGRDVPLVNANYWETLDGLQVNPADNAAAARIGIEGGSIQLGLHSLIVPPGAVSEPTLFRLSYASRSGIALDCAPSPLSFNVPVSLTLSYVGTQYEGLSGVELQVIFMADDDSFEVLPSVVNEAMNTVTAEVSHFSRYILA
jgi:hypothetical protein